MGYRDDLIARVQQQGIWSKLTGEQQQRYLELSDEKAGELLVMADRFDMRDEETIQQVVVASMARFLTLFRGLLVEDHDKNMGKLSSAGSRLAEFIEELRKADLSEPEIESGMRDFDTFMIATLMALHRCRGGAT